MIDLEKLKEFPPFKYMIFLNKIVQSNSRKWNLENKVIEHTTLIDI